METPSQHTPLDIIILQNVLMNVLNVDKSFPQKRL